MKIRFDKIKIKNFLSVGHKPIEYTYKSGLNMVIGKNNDTLSANGCGKSSIVVDALMFALFGKSVRNIKKADLVNSRNHSECEVEVQFTKNKDRYSITQGLEPRFVKVVKNGIELPTASTIYVDQREINKILGADYSTFLNTIFTCINYSKPFIELGKTEKREIIEDILGISVFGNMFEIAHTNFTESKEQNDRLHTDIRHLSKLVQSTEDHIKNVEDEKRKFQERKTKKLDELKKQFDSLKETISLNREKVKGKEGAEKTIIQIKDKFSCIDKSLIDLGKQRAVYDKEIKDSMENIESLNNEKKCIWCSTPVTAGTVKDHLIETEMVIKSSRQELKKIHRNIKTNEKKRLDLKEEMDRMRDKIKDIEISEYELASNIKRGREIHKKLKELKNEKFGFDKLINREDLDKNTIRLQKYQKSFLQNDRSFRYSEISRNILSEKGVKAYIIREILPFLNKRMNIYLKKLNSNFTIRFDEELNETIHFNNRKDFGYGNFSGGEKRRIDLALMLTLLDISKAQNVIDCNLQILDEVMDTSLDSEGVELFQNILRERIADDPEKAIYIITHRSEINAEHYDQIMRVIKERGFSRIEEM